MTIRLYAVALAALVSTLTQPAAAADSVNPSAAWGYYAFDPDIPPDLHLDRSRRVTLCSRFTASPKVIRWCPLLAAHFEEKDMRTALKIVHCESGGDPAARNPRSSAKGLWQHLGKYWTTRSVKAGIEGADIYDPVSSTIVAAWLRNSAGGWKHWKHCR
jgi:hypothetical protein